MKTEVEFLEHLVEVMESDRSSVAILNILETKVSSRLDRLQGGSTEPDETPEPPRNHVPNRQVEGRDT